MNSSMASNEKLKIVNDLNGDRREEMINDIRMGMTKTQKILSSKYFYDARGSRLFEQICMTREYYPTRTELSILERSADQMMHFFSEQGGNLIELGNGSTLKIRKLLDAVSSSERRRIQYVPVDICEASLRESARELLRDYANLNIRGIVADFTRSMTILPPGRKLILFFGSTIGNLTEEGAVALLRHIRSLMGPDDRFLLGMDQLKPVETIESAYNDGEGITRDFNLNILCHINNELRGDFDLKDFEHLAFFNTEMERVEMHLRARRNIEVRIADLGLSVDIRKGETIHTEICKKFSRQSAGRLFHKAGLSATRCFTDPRGWFSLVELQTRGVMQNPARNS